MRLANLNDILMDMVDGYNDISDEKEKLGFRKAMSIVRDAEIYNENSLPAVISLLQQLEDERHKVIKIQYNNHEYTVREICRMLDRYQETKEDNVRLRSKYYKAIDNLKYYLDANTENGVVHIPEFVISEIVNYKPRDRL